MSFLSKLLRIFSNKNQPAASNANTDFYIYELTQSEQAFCTDAKLQAQDGLFLKKLTKRPVEKLVFENEYSTIEKPDGICSLTTQENARTIITENRDKMISEGKYIFISDLTHNGYKVGLVGTTSNPYSIMEYAGTNGANYDIETKDIIDRYKKWDNEFGIRPIGIGFDFCECEIVNKNIDYKRLANEVYEFCPDVVEQGTETVELLAEEMERTSTIYLWWD